MLVKGEKQIMPTDKIYRLTDELVKTLEEEKLTMIHGVMIDGWTYKIKYNKKDDERLKNKR